jgi:SAM-dependent methyltransferase
MASTPERPTPALSVFDDAYATHSAPWVIGEPQPAIVTLEREGWVRGKILDVGCGTGEHTIYLSALRYDVYGMDSSLRAVEQARANAAARNVEAHFQVADALALGDDTTYDTVIDSALFHIFDADDHARYVRSLHLACRPGALVHVLALSDTGPAFGPQVSDATIREAFSQRWVLEDLRLTEYRGAIVRDEHAVALHRQIGEFVDLPAWLARARRI